jgi:hypothetical protein
METIEIKTLIDITNTKKTRANQGTATEFDQYRNYTTLMQCIGLRCIVTYDNDPIVETVDIKEMGFGSAYKGKHKVWTFRIRPDRQSAFTDDANDPVGLLKNDMHEIPIIGNLTETININKAVFYTYESQHKNTIIKAILGNS